MRSACSPTIDTRRAQAPRDRVEAGKAGSRRFFALSPARNQFRQINGLPLVIVVPAFRGDDNCWSGRRSFRARLLMSNSNEGHDTRTLPSPRESVGRGAARRLLRFSCSSVCGNFGSKGTRFRGNDGRLFASFLQLIPGQALEGGRFRSTNASFPEIKGLTIAKPKSDRPVLQIFGEQVFHPGSHRRGAQQCVPQREPVVPENLKRDNEILLPGGLHGDDVAPSQHPAGDRVGVDPQFPRRDIGELRQRLQKQDHISVAHTAYDQIAGTHTPGIGRWADCVDEKVRIERAAAHDFSCISSREKARNFSPRFNGSSMTATA